jgi:hypothetical protein
MSDPSPDDPRIDAPPAAAPRPVSASEWDRTEIETVSKPTRPRERLFPRKVMIGWALVAVAAYFGVRIATTVIKESMRGAVMSSGATTTRTPEGMVIQTPNGMKITIGRERGGGPSVIVTPGAPAKPIPPVSPTAEAAAAARATTAPAAPATIPPEAKKR